MHINFSLLLIYQIEQTYTRRERNNKCNNDEKRKNTNCFHFMIIITFRRSIVMIIMHVIWEEAPAYNKNMLIGGNFIMYRFSSIQQQQPRRKKLKWSSSSCRTWKKKFNRLCYIMTAERHAIVIHQSERKKIRFIKIFRSTLSVIYDEITWLCQNNLLSE
jgi:hypothetical protein